METSTTIADNAVMIGERPVIPIVLTLGVLGVGGPQGSPLRVAATEEGQEAGERART